MRTRDAEKEKLVQEKAIELIVKNGLESFSMNKLAKACKISVATLYIYYKDRDDLIISIAADCGRKMGEAFVKDLLPDMSFREGLWIQWLNRFKFMEENPLLYTFSEQLRTSSYQDHFLKSFVGDLEKVLGGFMKNVYHRGEIDEMPFEVYWSLAFAPLYSLLRFHVEGQSLGGRSFRLEKEYIEAAFDHVVKALKK